ncbi:uncharacterized protein si:dkey-91i10.2 [Entelurus aequoreus]|uniref:uncharacterized protein si:dkey-91i10.2 n=1 Tax=Entelurus aequoreus TaxID=161455 RepID=UPI002B1E006B|nr:uncharacterized protein si:dkey-91i10.2 [Entelurus aequoreus]XP_061923355.1 uncharacterized protein si:dkey-91i10.2 [Entelurus aequoreus]XP_061923356.1 uncharacterized protein si:dkey-91i10.2 [Entelurus aequoreus]
MEPCITNLPSAPDHLSTFPSPMVLHRNGLQGPAFPLMARCNSSTLLTNLGLRHCSGRHGPPEMVLEQGLSPDCCLQAGSSRLYRSMENLNWNSVSNSSLGSSNATTYRSVDSEFILRYTSESHWYDGPPDGSMVGGQGLGSNPESLAYYPQTGLPRKDTPLIPQLLFPGGVDEWDARKGLRVKLRLQSARSGVEPLKSLPLRPHLYTDDREGGHQNSIQPLCGIRLTCPQDIKQEVLRRLQLRRQNSSPNLAVHSTLHSSKGFQSSYTTDNLSGNKNKPHSISEFQKGPVGRLYIPTFEEFKRMRQKGRERTRESTAVPVVQDNLPPSEDTGPPQRGGLEADKSTGRTSSPVCTSPSPRSPLKPQTSTTLRRSVPTGQEDDSNRRRRRCSLEPTGSIPFPLSRQNLERPSSCCPALLTEATDLSSYGAKIYKMKDGLIGSALDLIKKSCSAEISSEAPVRLSADPHAGPQPPAVAMATTPTTARGGVEVGEETAAGEEEAECTTARGCRRSSSDAAYELSPTLKAQRECRLRPHYSDPMPADASKRKQLEMKIAASAHNHRRERDSAPAALRGHSEPPGEERQVGLGLTRTRQHRWSTISSLSADSGVVGLSDEREEEDSQPRRQRRSRGAEVERVDSGIGPGLSRSWKRPSASLRNWDAHRPCLDCGRRDEAGKERCCERCCKLRTERKEALLEFLNTESSYGEDLRIIKEEFFCPMQSAGLLTAEQLTVVFANVQELIDVNDRFTEHLQDSIDQALDQGDEDLLTVSIGEIFLEFVNMLPAFQTYCLQQSTSVNMLNALEKEKELLRIFLDVSQNDNTALRRMNLRSFLMAPLQRVTKYPLLLSRIIKVTPENHPEFARLREAKSRVESHLEHINMKTKQEGNGVSWSLRSFRRDSRKNREVINIEMREVSMKTVGWARENTRFVMEGPIQLSQPADGQWVKKGTKALKFQNVQSLLMVRTVEGQGQSAELEEGGGESIQDGVLVLIKDKSSGKFAVLREPIHLGNCVVSMDPECDDTFEVLDIRRESFVFRASDKSRTQHWFHQIKRYARDLGTWRKRRNALPNIMISTNQSRS